MVTRKDVLADSGDWISLGKLLGKRIVDVEGAVISHEGYPLFQAMQIVFADGGYVWLNGLYDCAYVEAYDEPNLEPEVLETLRED